MQSSGETVKDLDKQVQIEIDIEKQLMLVNSNNGALKKFQISTSKYKVGNTFGSNQTPWGKHIISEKIGEFAEIYSIFKSRKNTGIICDSLNNERFEDLILTRILRLKGQEDGINLGYNVDGICVDSFARCIYIHGTNREDLLATPASHGCIRMGNQDIIDLFNIVSEGTVVDIKLYKPSKAMIAP